MNTKPKILVIWNEHHLRPEERGDEPSHARASARSVLNAIVVLLTLAFSAPLCAQSVEEVCSGTLETFQEPPFEFFDQDRDEHIQMSESQGCRSLHSLFAELDVNDDERLSRIEYAAFAFIWAERARAFGLDP